MTEAEGPAGLELVRLRSVVAGPIEAWFPLRPGERALVGPGEAVVRSAPLAERIREPRTEVVDGPGSAEPGSWWTGLPGRRKAEGRGEGELLFRSGGRWRVGVGDPTEPLEAPFGGIVREVTPGSGLTVESPARALLGADVLGGSSAGRQIGRASCRERV